MFDYFAAAKRDIVANLIPLFGNKSVYVRDDGKIGIKTYIIYQGPWLYAKVADQRHRLCTMAHTIYHPTFRFIHSNCMECWKVVARPRNLVELFEVFQYQKELRLPGKSGVEVRPFICGNYGSYWYTNSVEEGLELKDTVKKDFPDVPIILKRGCTEFERSHGPSNKWCHTTESKELEEYLESVLVLEDNVEAMKNFPDYVVLNTKRRWVEFAFDRGDLTYKNFTGGEPLYPGVCEYSYPEEIKNGCQLIELIGEGKGNGKQIIRS